MKHNGVKDFRENIDSHNLENGVLKPTSRSEHILDFIIYDKDYRLISDIGVEPDFLISHFHRLVTFSLCLTSLCLTSLGEVSNKIFFCDETNFDPYEIIEKDTRAMLTRLIDVNSGLEKGMSR